MELKKLREKKRVSGKGRIALIVATPLIGLFLSFAISSLGSCEEQMSEGIIRKSPLVWRADEGGDYLLSPMSPNETYELISPIESEGQIKTITATWGFKGEVKLEVSANNGVDYTPVVNGVPLTSGFVSGNQLKWKATLGSESELTEVKITYTDTKDVLSTFGSSQLSGFKFRKLLYVSNPSGKELFNYQLKIKVGESPGTAFCDVHCGGNIPADFQDIRFTATDGETLLAHYLEEIAGAAPNRIATFYVKVPQLPAEGLSLYLYYGNSDAEDLSNPEDVFDFFDDFSSPVIPAQAGIQKWEITQGTATVSDAQLKLDGAEVLSSDYQIKDGIIEYRAKAGAGNEIRLILRSEEEDVLESANQIAYSSSYEGAEHCIAVGDIVKANQAQAIPSGVTYDYRIILQGTNLTFQRYSQNYEQLQAEVTYKDTGGLTSGNIGLKAGAGCTSYFDRVRVRKFAAAEPVVSSSGEEEPVNLPQFSDTTLAENGNVIASSLRGADLSSEALAKEEGDEAIPTYTTAPVSTACNISAITPSLRATGGSSVIARSDSDEAISIDISADGGLNWKTDCVSGRTYSAPGDFTAGRELLLRANLSTSSLRGAEGDEAILTPEIEELKLDYSIAPIVTSANIYSSGATGEQGVYILGDAIVVEWDNSLKGDNNADIISVSCNFAAFGGDAQAKMSDDDNDNIYTCRYELPAGINTTSNIFITATNLCGIATRDGHILSVDTRTEEEKKEVLESQRIRESEEIDLEELVERGQRPGTTLYELLIKLGDNYHPDPEEDARGCYKHGAVVVIRPSGHLWSETERNSFLIVQVYLTEEERTALTRPKELATDELDEDGRPVMKRMGRRAKRFQLEKLGLSKTDRGREKLREVGNLLKSKALRRGVIEEK